MSNFPSTGSSGHQMPAVVGQPSRYAPDDDDDHLVDLPPEAYVVGKGRPPRDHQFKKGVSGNPRGRPRKVVDIDAVFDKSLLCPVTIGQIGNRRRVAAVEAVTMRLIRQAIEGDIRAIKLVFDKIDRIASLRAAQAAEEIDREQKKRRDNPLDIIDYWRN